jgi:phage-related minor tail protein
MTRILKLFALLVFTVMIFGAGYLLGSFRIGSQRMEELGRLLTKVRSETSEKTSGLEKEIQLLRIRIHLFTARQRLTSAQAALAERNYGVVQKELEKVKKELTAMKELSDPKTKEALSSLDDPLNEMMTAAGRADPELKKRLDAFRSELDRVTES